MMSICALGNLSTQGSAARAAAKYYQEQGQDYYIKDFKERSAGEWFGVGADRLKISGPVDQKDLQLAFAGYIAGRQVQNAGDPKRQMGWDVTFSAPKSVSSVWAFADLVMKTKIEEAHKQAVKEVFGYLESQTVTRRGKGGMIIENASIVGGLFTHHVSRCGDPQLHTHVVIPNFCVREDGTVGTIKSEHLYELKMTAGALYQAQLAYNMRHLGYRVEADKKGTFRLADMNPETEKLFSKRDQEIKRMVKERGIETYAGTRTAVLATRPDKVVTSLKEREAYWQKEIQEAGLDARIKQFTGSAPLKEKTQEEIFALAEQKLIDRESVFKEKDMVREIACASFGQLTAQESISAFKNYEARGLIIYLGSEKKSGKKIFTTKNMQELEQQMIRRVERLSQKDYFAVNPASILKQSSLSEEQKFAVEAATGKSGIVVIQGRAGAGKTVTLSVIREIYEKKGWRVEGITISGQAAQNLQKESGIESKTIASWKTQGQIDKHTIVVIDEAGMVGSKQINEILEKIENFGAKVILVGDEKQLQPIEAGNALRAVDQKLIDIAPEFSSRIETIRRQKEAWMRETVKEAAQGNITQALENLDDHKKIAFYRNASSACGNLVKDFVEKEAFSPREAIILSSRKSDVSRINDTIKLALQEKGVIKEDLLEVDNGQRKIGLAVGDRVVLTRNDYALDVRNGQRGIIEEINNKRKEVIVKLDNNKEKVISTEKYNHIDHGWASTVHKVQGLTVERAYVFSYSNELMASAQISYVQISRAKEETKLYIARGEKAIEREKSYKEKERDKILKEDERQEVLEELCRNWGRDRMKLTTLDFEKQQEQVKKRADLVRKELDKTIIL